MKIKKFTYMMLFLGVFALVMHTTGCVDEPEYPGAPIFADTDLIEFVSPASDTDNVGGSIEWKDPGDNIDVVIFVFSSEPFADQAQGSFTDLSYDTLVGGAWWGGEGMSEGSINVIYLKTPTGTPPNVTFSNTSAGLGGAGSRWIVIVGYSNGIITHSSPKWRGTF